MNASLCGAMEEAQGTRASLAYAYAQAGRVDDATKILHQLKETAKTRFVSAYSFALVHLGLGRIDQALNWLEKAYDERASALPFLSVNPRFASLHGNPRFAKLIAKLGVGR